MIKGHRYCKEIIYKGREVLVCKSHYHKKDRDSLLFVYEHINPVDFGGEPKIFRGRIK